MRHASRLLLLGLVLAGLMMVPATASAEHDVTMVGTDVETIFTSLEDGTLMVTTRTFENGVLVREVVTLFNSDGDVVSETVTTFDPITGEIDMFIPTTGESDEMDDTSGVMDMEETTGEVTEDITEGIEDVESRRLDVR